MHREPLWNPAYLLRAFCLAVLLMLLMPAAYAAENQGLSWLAVHNGIFSPVFSENRSTYYAILENWIDTFEAANVELRPYDEDAQVQIVCLDALNEDGTLPEGKRTNYMIIVTEENGETVRYYLKLYRKAAYTAPIDENHQLAKIQINGGAVEVPAFSGIKAYYEVTVPSSVTELDIQAYPADRSKMAYVINAPRLMPDEPVCVSILVKSSSGDEDFSIYTLILKREGFAQSKAYTGLQLAAAALAAFSLGVCVPLAVLLRRRKSTAEEAGQNENAG